jgi:hypothetical protein
MLQTITNNATFGPAPTFNTEVGFALALSPDKKAFTATFAGLEAIIDGTSAPPIVTRVFSFSIPLTDAEPGQEIPFFVSGFAVGETGASAHLAFSVNDQSTIAYLPINSKDEGFVHQLKYKTTGAKEARITVFLVASRDSKSNAAVHVTVSAIDTDIVKH